MTDRSSQTSQRTASILIADDDSNARLWLRRFLEREGYVVEEAEYGAAALDLFEQFRPDIVLLDAVMPDLDGFEVCARLRTLSGGDRTPVLMITGLDDEQSVERAFEAGAIDYVTKPIQWAVLRHRVRRLVDLRQLKRTRDDLMQMIVHDMKNPISIINGFSELLMNDGSPGQWREDAVARIHQSSNTLFEMTVMILDIGRLEEGKLALQPSTRAVFHVLKDVKESFAIQVREQRINIEIESCPTDIIATLDWELLHRVLANLISNAIKHSPQDSTITLSCCAIYTPEQYLQISVADQGEGIALQDQKRIFDKFTQAEQRRKGSRIGTGLGLTFCKLAVEAHGGYIEVESQIGVGSKFTIVLPHKQGQETS